MTWPTIRSDWLARPVPDVPGQMVYAETIFWHPAGEKPPIDQDVLVTFEDVKGSYIAAWMGSEQGWIGVDALPFEKIAWWAVLPPGPVPAMTAAASGLDPQPAP
jgi:hypothetical protein